MDEIVTLHNKQFVKYISESEIENMVEKLAILINKDYKNDIPFFLITLNGALFFCR